MTEWKDNPCPCRHPDHGGDKCGQNMAPNAPSSSKCSSCIVLGH